MNAFNYLRVKLKWLVLSFALGLTISVGFSEIGIGEALEGMDTSVAKPGTEPIVRPQAPFNAAEVGQIVVSEVVDKLATVITTLENNPALIGAGETIMAMLFVIVMAWTLLKAMMGKGVGQFIEEMIVVFLYWGIVYAILYAGGIAAIKGFIDSIATAFAGEQMGTLKGALTTTVNASFKAISDILTMPSSASEISWKSPGNWIPLAISALIQFVGKLLTSIMLALALVVYASNIVISFASIALAIAFAPILVPFLILPATSFLFDGWFRFFLGACMMKAVGAFFMKFTNEMMVAMASVAEKIRLPPDTDMLTMLNANFMVYVSCIILAVMSAHIMSMVPGIATGLISGSAANAGFKGMNAAIGGAGLRAAASGASSAGKQAGKSAGAMPQKLKDLKAAAPAAMQKFKQTMDKVSKL